MVDSGSADSNVNVEELAQAVLTRNRVALGRAITLVESTHPDRREAAMSLIRLLEPHAGECHRVAITGVPGSGKSTLIDSLGTLLTSQGHRVGVLTVDPSSTQTGGSILGDKTRMNRLINDDLAFIRSSPSSGTLGGVTDSTHKAMLVLDAAGFDVVLVETMGVGQSEAAVHAIVDCFCVLLLSDSGDDLQMVKRGVLELADVIAINKTDGSNEQAARRTAAEMRRALPMLTSRSSGISTQVLAISALHNIGVDDLWGSIVQHREALASTGELAQRRANGRRAAMRTLLQQRLLERLDAQPKVAAQRRELEEAVARGEIMPEVAVDELIDLLN